MSDGQRKKKIFCQLKRTSHFRSDTVPRSQASFARRQLKFVSSRLRLGSRTQLPIDQIVNLFSFDSGKSKVGRYRIGRLRHTDNVVDPAEREEAKQLGREDPERSLVDPGGKEKGMISPSGEMMNPRKGFVYSGVSRRDSEGGEEFFLTVDEWLKRKKGKDGAEGLWRIHDGLYDLRGWLKNHPGGGHWLEVTKGADVTEAFECSHVTEKPKEILKKFHVRQAETPRNSLITFEENGFYRTLKRKIAQRKLLEAGSTKPQRKTKMLADALTISVFATALLGVAWSLWFQLISGILLGMLTVCAHNFFHMGDNWRMRYFCLSLMSLREWRISHVLSHHLYPNTEWDLEVRMVEPLWRFLPREDKKFPFFSWAASPFLMVSLAHFQFVRRFLGTLLSKKVTSLSEELVGFSLPLFLLLASGQGLWKCFLAWNVVIAFGSLTFGFIGFTAAHHHPDIYHEGDFLGNDKDFGILQLAAVRNRIDVDGNFFLTMITFGQHALHHLFPTVDHSKLAALDPVFEETCREFKINFKPFKSRNLVTGMFRQLIRNSINAKLNILEN